MVVVVVEGGIVVGVEVVDGKGVVVDVRGAVVSVQPTSQTIIRRTLNTAVVLLITLNLTIILYNF